MNKIRVAGLVSDSIVDGPGLRYAIFTQGCPHCCEGCHNPDTHDPKGGYEVEISQILKEIDSNPLLDGITLTGGEPLMQADNLIPLVQQVKARNLSVVLYSGYTFEEIMENDSFQRLVLLCDILIEGRFEQEKRSLDLLYKGSANQRIIDLKKTLEDGRIQLWEQNHIIH